MLVRLDLILMSSFDITQAALTLGVLFFYIIFIPEVVLRGIHQLEERRDGERSRDSHLQADRRGTLQLAGHLGSHLQAGRPDSPPVVDLGSRPQADHQDSLLLLGILTF